jgi:hypothetical protein
MRVSLMAFALAALVSGAPAENHDLTTAILVQPIHDAQVGHADDGKDHVDYELLVVNAFAAPVTLSSVIVLDPSGKELGRIEGDALAAATQTLLAQTPGASIPASAAASVDVDLALPAGTAPDRVTHRIVYAIKPDAPLASIVGTFSISGPEVQVNRAPAITIRPPLTGKGWWAANGCCAPNAHRHPHCHRRVEDRDAGDIRNRLDSTERRQNLRRRRREKRRALRLRRRCTRRG